MPFNFNATNLENKDIVVYEELWHLEDNNTWSLIAEHKVKDGDADQEKQIMHYPKIRTTLFQNDVTGINNRSTEMSGAKDNRSKYAGSNNAKNPATYTNGSKAKESTGKDKYITYVDRVAYDNLIVGHRYLMQATLWGKETLRDTTENSESRTNPARPVKGRYLAGYTDYNGTYHEGSVDYGNVTGKTYFIPKEKSGTIDVKIQFDSNYAPGTLIVAFEDLKVNPLNETGRHNYDYNNDHGGKPRFVDDWSDSDKTDQIYKDADRVTVRTTADRSDNDEVIIATHSNINDKNQSIMSQFFQHLNTGGTGARIFFIIAAAFAAAGAVLLLKKKK